MDIVSGILARDCATQAARYSIAFHHPSEFSMIPNRFAERIRQIHQQLCIPEDYGQGTALVLHEEPDELVSTEPDFFGREQRLTPEALAAWQAMRLKAQADGIEVFLISAFRSIDYQSQLIRRKLDAGQTIAQILRVNAAPGYSEHHTGRAIDVGTSGCPALEEVFEATAAFRWLQENAAEFGFTLSYPRDNSCGISYEPWHWCYHANR